jgi:hypothetical protein
LIVFFGYNFVMAKRLLSSGDAAKLLGMSRKQFLRWASELPYVRRGLGWHYYWIEDIERFREFITGKLENK